MDRSDHILIVDDDAEIRNLLGRYLQKNGLRTTAVADGRAMWHALESSRIVALRLVSVITRCPPRRRGRRAAMRRSASEERLMP